MSVPRVQLTDQLLESALRERVRGTEPELAADILQRASSIPQIQPWWAPLFGITRRPLLVFGLIGLLIVALAGALIGAALLLELADRETPRRNGSIMVVQADGCRLEAIDSGNGERLPMSNALIGCPWGDQSMAFTAAAARDADVLAWSTYWNCLRCLTSPPEDFQSATGVWVRDESRTERQIAECRDAVCLVDLSANGTLVAYSVTRLGDATSRLMITDLTGNPRAAVDLPGVPAVPRFSPDGAFVAVALRLPSGGASVVTVASDVGVVEEILASDDWIDVLEWAPDGGRIAAVAYGEILSFRPDGSDLVTIDSAAPALHKGLAWSPDSRRLITVTTTQNVGPDSPDEVIVPTEAIVELDLDPATPRRVLLDTHGAFCIGNLTYSPDGAWIAFGQRTPFGDLPTLRVMGADGSEPRSVAPISDYIYSPPGIAEQPLMWLEDR